MPTPQDLKKIDERFQRFWSKYNLWVDCALVVVYTGILLIAWYAGYLKGLHSR